jgi:hypothetical protein
MKCDYCGAIMSYGCKCNFCGRVFCIDCYHAYINFIDLHGFAVMKCSECQAKEDVLALPKSARSIN